jgi:transaldolase
MSTSTINSSLASLNTVGQSIWYDNLSRDVLESGELQGLIDQGVTGLTSNPSIFQKAISDSDKYDKSIVEILQSQQVDDEQLCEQLMIADVAKAADLLLPIYEATNGSDGHASIEVSPFLAADTAGTILAAKRIWAALDRPNIMIKVPATPEGIPAIRQLLRDGINVNVTLIFSEPVYKNVAKAFVQALSERQENNESVVGIASVASFFISRVDAAVEKQLTQLPSISEKHKDALIGKVGIANSIVAYAAFERIFDTKSAYKSLASAGAALQRPLWASTGVKNPSFSDLLYVSSLAAPHTVNTLPPATLEQLLTSEEVFTNAIASKEKEALACLALLKEVSIDLGSILQDLQAAGVKSFADSYKSLLEAVAQKRQRLQSSLK